MISRGQTLSTYLALIATSVQVNNRSTDTRGQRVEQPLRRASVCTARLVAKHSIPPDIQCYSKYADVKLDGPALNSPSVGLYARPIASANDVAFGRLTSGSRPSSFGP